MKKAVIILFILSFIALSSYAQQKPIPKYYFINGVGKATADNLIYFDTWMGYKFLLPDYTSIPIGHFRIKAELKDNCDFDSTVFDGCLTVNESIDFDWWIGWDCCIGVRGEWYGDSNYYPDIADLLCMVDYFFVATANPCYACLEESDVHPDGVIDIEDLLDMVSIMFDSENPPFQFPSCPLDTIITKLSELPDSATTDSLFTFYFLPDNQMVIENSFGYQLTGVHNNVSFIVSNQSSPESIEIWSGVKGSYYTVYKETRSLSDTLFDTLYFVKQ